MKCKICKNRQAITRHAKDYNHKNIKAPGNKVLLCEECHTAFHQLNHKNNLDWDYMIKKKQEIIKLADTLEKRHRPIREGGQILDEVLDPPSPRPLK